jgi:hypothetical protein
MSRHRIPGLNPNLEIYVGWDHPLLTFFGQVYDPAIKEGEDDPIIYWVGTSPRKIYRVEDLVRVMRRYAEIDPDMQSTLYFDKDLGR